MKMAVGVTEDRRNGIYKMFGELVRDVVDKAHNWAQRNAIFVYFSVVVKPEWRPRL